MVMMSNALTNAGILGAEEIAMLTQVFEDLSTAPQYLEDKAARDQLARKILQEFQSGVTDVYALKQACRPRDP
jgi:hypothetical protein